MFLLWVHSVLSCCLMQFRSSAHCIQHLWVWYTVQAGDLGLIGALEEDASCTTVWVSAQYMSRQWHAMYGIQLAMCEVQPHVHSTPAMEAS
jgi:NADH:ubiquinone oxidoreductase subunit C